MQGGGGGGWGAQVGDREVGVSRAGVDWSLMITHTTASATANKWGWGGGGGGTHTTASASSIILGVVCTCRSTVATIGTRGPTIARTAARREPSGSSCTCYACVGWLMKLHR
jgi:hypothetical protein